jgi:2-isopropylmalate synthase
LAALAKAFTKLGLTVNIANYQEHSAEYGSKSDAYAYVEIEIGSQRVFGVGCDGSILNASLQSLLSAINRAVKNGSAAQFRAGLSEKEHFRDII